MAQRHRRPAGFSLIELLTVVGIVAVLLALLMPALSEARRNAQAVQCASNMRQLTTALVGYATEFRGKFPSNAQVYKVYWYNRDQVGRHIRAPITMSDRSLGGGVFVCPGDVEGAVRSYAMNIWASGVVSPAVVAAQRTDPPRGKLFTLGVGESSNMILLAEAYSSYHAPEETEPKVGYSTHAVIGFIGEHPGERFIGKGEPDPGDGSNRFGPTESQVCWFRHRKRGDRYATITQARGRANFGFADGHVEMLSHTDCADPATGKSTFRAMWSPIDREID
jgi:prepilin-type processing-associated H-X9-DG protein/prepilin-type N-terminal cleavage/methylation domain-containing protein